MSAYRLYLKFKHKFWAFFGFFVLILLICIFVKVYIDTWHLKRYSSIYIYNEIEFKSNLTRNLLLGSYAKNLQKKPSSLPKEIDNFLERHYSIKHDSYKELEKLLHEKRALDSSKSFKPFEYVVVKFDSDLENRTLGQIASRKIGKHTTTLEKLQYGIRANQLYGVNDTLVSQILKEMATDPIQEISRRMNNRALRFKVKFRGGNQAILKLMRTKREQEALPEHHYFNDFERHNAEIAVFHLDRLLGFRRTFPVTGRKLNATSEIYQNAYHELRRHFFKSPPPFNQTCFYDTTCGIYCDKHHALCGNPDMIEGSFTAMLPEFKEGKRKRIPHPWRRSYIIGQKAKWEDDENYCEKVRENSPYDEPERILDLMDLSILDFLSGNHDRFEYEVFSQSTFGDDGQIIYSDHGRAFGKPHYDDMLILAPVDQCCLIRESTMKTLLVFHNGVTRLSTAMRESLKHDPINPVLWEPHFEALDRRVPIILETIRACVDAVEAYQIEFGNKTNVILISPSIQPL